jgi:tRNA (guanine-N7-)-methyltransferase
MSSNDAPAPRLYDDAPRLPDGERVDVRSLAAGAWVEVEVGPGRGWFLVERAAVEPRAALVGVEIRRKWATIVDRRLASRGLGPRARVFAEDARTALPRLTPDASVRRLFVNFPDPWWKKRHAKRLLVAPDFLAQAARLLEPEGELFVQTDVEERADALERMIDLDARFSPGGSAAGSARLDDNPYGARSPRERRAIADGLPVHRMMWRRRAVLASAALAAAWLAWAAPARADAAPTGVLSKGPYLTELSESGANVRFELAAPSAATVEVHGDGPVEARQRSFADPTTAAMHVIGANGLAASTRYAYAVRVRGKVAAEGHFTTLPAPGTSPVPVHFLVYGDDRSDPAAHAAVVKWLVATPSDFLVNTGDLVADGGRALDWQAFFDIEGALLRDRALFVSIGNHELHDDAAGSNFARYFGFIEPGPVPRPYGTARVGSTRLFFLNSKDDWSGGEEREWLERELARADAEPGLMWRIAVVHQGPWSSGPHGPSPSLVAGHVPALLAAHHIDLIFSGHDHIYERGVGEGMKYVVSGGGGAPLYPIKLVATARKAEAAYHFVDVSLGADALRIVARRVDGSIIDQCGFHKGADWDCDPPPAPRPTAPKAQAVAPTPPASPVAQRGCVIGVGLRDGAAGSWAAALGLALAALRRRRLPG